jgi:restriction system protein
VLRPRRFYRIMAGSKSRFAQECYAEGFIGGDWGMDFDLSPHLREDWRTFNSEMIPEFLVRNSEKSKVAAGLACGMLHTICFAMSDGDVILMPDGSGSYFLGEIAGQYFYVEGEVLPHRRSVIWQARKLPRADMSQALQNSSGSVGTVCDLTPHSVELELLLRGETVPDEAVSLQTEGDSTVFALEKYLEQFLVDNWTSTELGNYFDIYADESGMIGQQYPTDTGKMDILAISKDKKTLMVVELKKGRASDSVVGQVLRYMGYVQEELAENGQVVRGCIIALEDDLRIKRALVVTPSIEFYRYNISFKLVKA